MLVRARAGASVPRRGVDSRHARIRVAKEKASPLGRFVRKTLASPAKREAQPGRWVIHFDQVEDRARVCGVDRLTLAGGILGPTPSPPDGLRTAQTAPDPAVAAALAVRGNEAKREPDSHG